MKLSNGTFVVDRVYDRPAELANLNLEGFALAPDSTCVDGAKEVICSDDGHNGGHSLWSGTISCDLGLAIDTPGGGDGGGSNGTGGTGDAGGNSGHGETAVLANTGTNEPNSLAGLLAATGALLAAAGALMLIAKRRA